MKALSVRQPFASAIVYLHKTPENRTRSFSYRGRLVIHASAQWFKGDSSHVAVAALDQGFHALPLVTSACIGEVDLVDCHPSERGCCSEWGAIDHFHLELADPVAYATAVPCRGALGLWETATHPDLQGSHLAASYGLLNAA